MKKCRLWASYLCMNNRNNTQMPPAIAFSSLFKRQCALMILGGIIFCLGLIQPSSIASSNPPDASVRWDYPSRPVRVTESPPGKTSQPATEAFDGGGTQVTLKKEGLLDLSKKDEKKIEDSAGIEHLFPVASKKFGRPVRNENQLYSQVGRHVEKWGTDFMKSTGTVFLHLWNQPIEEQHRFLCGIGRQRQLYFPINDNYSSPQTFARPRRSIAS